MEKRPPENLIPRIPAPNIKFSRFGHKGHMPPYIVKNPAEVGSDTASFSGTFEEFQAAFLSGDSSEEAKSEFQKQLQNRVRKCPKCSKSCGDTMVLCNGCGFDISNVECTYTTNVFTLFICGVQKMNEKRALSISLRYESENYFIMDDLNAMSLCHMVVVPTSFYIPDVRYLYQKPREGLELVKHMRQLGTEVFRQQFLQVNNDVKKYFYEDQMEGDGFEEQFQKHIICCFNLPPSQFQIHMQFIFSPIVESLRWDCNTSHFMAGRCFPLEYVTASLSKLADMGSCITDAPALQSKELIYKIYEATQVRYDIFLLEKFGHMYKTFESSSFYNGANLDQNYQYKVDHSCKSGNGKGITKIGNEAVDVVLSRDEMVSIIKSDKAKLSNFGRSPGGNKEGLNYYTYGKTPPLKTW